MKSENELAMITAFYLSKFGEEGLARLGYETYRQAFQEIGRILHVNPNSVKNWRDEFDPYYDNGRKGWHQRDTRPSRQKVMATFDPLSEEALRAIVLDIISDADRSKVEKELRSALKEIEATDDRQKTHKKVEYVARGRTGRLAEEFFVSRFNAGLTPFNGAIKDCRDDGTGFDFEITIPGSRTLVEIKGLAAELGGITFTDKEWKVANKIQDGYFLGLVTQVLTSPQIGFVQNPARNLVPVYYAYTTVAVNWTVDAEQVANIKLL
jgi:hypothetical protein